MDIKRLLNKKVLLAGILIYLFQAVAFAGTQVNHIGLGDFIRQNRQYNQQVKELRQLPLAEGVAAAEELLAADRNTVTLALMDKMKYLAGYGTSIETIFANAEKLKEFSIFQDQNRYSYANTVKTAKDFEKMRGVLPALDRDRATQHTLDFSYLSFFVFALMLYVLYEILRERDNGMWAVTHAMKNGRCRLAVNRAIGLAVITAAFYALCFLTNLIISCVFYGVDDFGGYIQTIQAYAKYPLPLSKAAYLCLFAVKSSLALIAAVMLAYLVFTALHSRNLAVVALLAGFAGEWQLMRRIPVYSNLKTLRYVNLMRIFDGAALDREYQNLNILGRPVSASAVLLWVEVLLLAACLGLAVWVYGRRYPGKRARFDRLLGPVKRAVQKLLERLPFGLKEAYKVLVSKRGLIFMAFGALACFLIFDKTVVHFPDLQQRMDEAYLSDGGSDWRSFNAYVEELEQQREQFLLEAEEMTEQIRAGLLEPEKVTEVSILQNQAASILNYLKEYHAKQEQQRTVQEEKGIAIYAMSDRGYNEIMGPNSKLREVVTGVILIMLSVLFASQTFGFEGQAHTKPLLKSAGRGIAWLWRRKIICIFSIVGVTLIAFLGAQYLALFQRYQTPYLEAPIQSLTFLAGSTMHLSILQFLALNVLFKAVLPVCAAANALFISAGRKMVNLMYVPVLIVVYAAAYVSILLSGVIGLLLASVVCGAVLTGLFVAGSYRKWRA